MTCDSENISKCDEISDVRSCDSRNSSDSSCDRDARVDLYKEIVRPPVPGDTLVYDLNFDKPYFSIINGYMTAVPACYEYKLCNSLSLLLGDTLKLSVSVPKQVLGCRDGYEIPEGTPIFTNLSGSLKIEAANHCDTLALPNGGNTILAVNNCGWITFELSVVLPYDYNDVCSICYSICFQGLRLTSLYGKCKKMKCRCKNKKCRKSYEHIKMESKTCLQITAVSIG